ncbi:MAG: HigA family addiction module antidote protein [Bacteroidales bacterium]|nr:HigA family addiction module antidote protein [Bacteroidales bacterium]
METNDQMMYSANGVRPVFPVHPGEILGEELTARGISGKEFAQMAGMQATHVSAIIHGTRNVTQPVAEKIAKVLDGISAEFWLKMQKEYNIAKNRKTKGVSGLVSGYGQSGTPAVARALAEPESSYGNKCQVLLSVPLPDKALLEQLAGRMDWKIL